MDGQIALSIQENNREMSTKRGQKEEPHLVNTFWTNESLNPEPKQGQNYSADDTKIAKPESKWRAIKDRERYVKFGTNSAVQYHDDSYNGATQSNRRESLLPTCRALA